MSGRPYPGLRCFVLLFCLPWARLYAHPYSQTPTLSELKTSNPLDLAHQELAAGQLAAADAATRRALVESPNSAEAMYLLARILQSRGRPTESLSWLTRAARVTSPTGEDLRIAALDYILLNSTVDALHWLQRSVALDPANSEAWYDLGRAQMTTGDYAGAETPLRKAIALHPRLVKAENNLGLVYEAVGKPGEAARAYQLAIAWQVDDPKPSEQPLLNYGILLISQQRAPEALPLLDQAASLAPQDAKCHEQLAKALDQTGSVDRAAAELRQAVILDPQNPRLHFQLGQVLRRAGKPQEARAELQLSEHLYGQKSSEPGKGSPH